MVKIIMHGCNGKMGKVITDICANDPEVTIVAGVDVTENPNAPYPVFKSLSDFAGEADVVIDFSSAKITDELLKACVDKKLPLVLCTTGLSDDQIARMKEASKAIPVLKSANMSLGINLIMKELKNLTKVLSPAGFDIEIVEKHHNQKVDAPSGTALALADAARPDESFEYVYDRTKERKKRSDKEIGIAAVRGGTITGEHEVIYAGQDEVITITHTAYSRALFGNGAVAAAKFLSGKAPGMYDMSDVIG